MLWFLKVPILGQILRKGIKKAVFWGIFFFPASACGTWVLLWNTDYCWSHRQITQFLHPSHLASHSLPQYASRERTHLNKMSHLCVMYQSALVPEISQAFVTRDVVQGEQLSAINGKRVHSGHPWEHLICARLQAESEDEEIAVWCPWKTYFCHSLNKLGRSLLCGNMNVFKTGQRTSHGVRGWCFLLQSLWKESFWNTFLSMSMTRQWLGTVRMDLSRVNHAFCGKMSGIVDGERAVAVLYLAFSQAFTAVSHSTLVIPS